MTLEELHAVQEELLAARADAEAERERFRELFASAQDGYMLTSGTGRIEEANIAVATLLNVSGQYLVGKPVVVYIHPQDRARLSSQLRLMKSAKRSEMTLRVLPRRGNERMIHATVNAARDRHSGRTSLRWMLRDITSQREAEEALHVSREQLRQMSSKLAMVEEQERRRIAMEIHDHIGQSLAAAKLKLGMLRLTLSGEQAAAVDEIRDLLSQTLAQTRTLTFELSPTILYELGLGAAIEWLIEQRSHYGVRFEFVNQLPGLRLPRKTEIMLFQSVRELLANVIRHAAATQARLTLRRQNRDVVLEVEDDGIGFDFLQWTQRPDRDPSIGLLSVQERLDHLAGHTEIQSAPGRGTRVRLVAPSRVLRKTSNRNEHHAPQRAYCG